MTRNIDASVVAGYLQFLENWFSAKNQTSANRTNARKALRLALSSPSEVIAMLKGLKNKTNCLVIHKARKSKTNTGTTALQRSEE